MRSILALLVAAVVAACGSSPAMHHLGGRAPDFTLKDTDGNDVHLKALLAHGPVMLVFFPKAFTMG